MKSMGIIGFGQFGQLVAAQLAGRFHIGVHDVHVTDDVIAAAGFQALSFEHAAASDVVVIAVPVQVMEEIIIAAAPHARPGATIVDVASVKMLPSRWLAEHMPNTVHIVATHPLFGPQSATQQGGIAGRQLVICPIRGDQHLKIAALGEELGLRVRITSAEEHDREMGYVQALTHLIGRSLSAMGIPDESLKTRTYQHLLDLIGLIDKDSFELFTAIQTLNPFAQEIVEEFVANVSGLLEQVNGKNMA